MSALYVIKFQTANNEDWRESFALEGADGPENLAGAMFAMDVVNNSGAPVLQLSTENGRIVIEDAAAGQFSINVPATAMAAVQPGTYKHDLVMITAAGNVRRIWYGEVNILRGLTQPGAAP